MRAFFTKYGFKILFTLLAINLAISVYVAATTPPTPTHCLAGIVMVQDKGGDYMVQKGTFPKHCMPIDRN